MFKTRKGTADLRRAMLERKQTMTQKEFALSSAFSSFVTTGVKAIFAAGGRTPVPIEVIYDTRSEITGYSTGDSCLINAGNAFFKKAGKKDEIPLRSYYYMILGVIFHEIGHMLYSVMSLRRSFGNMIKKGTIPKCSIPVPDDIKDDYEEMMEFIQNPSKVFLFYGCLPQSLREFLAASWLGLQNSVEDARIENLLLTNLGRFSGFCKGLRVLRENQYNGIKKKDMKDNDLVSFQNAVLCYAKYGELKGIKPCDAVSKALPIIDEMVVCHESLKFCDYTTLLLACEWSLIKDFIAEYAPQNDGDGDSGESDGDSNQNGDGEGNGAESSSEKGEGEGRNSDDSGDPEDGGNPFGSASGEESDKSPSDNEKLKEENEASEGDSSKSQKEKEKDLSKQLEKMIEELTKQLDEIPDEMCPDNDSEEGKTDSAESIRQDPKESDASKNENDSLNGLKEAAAEALAKDDFKKKAMDNLNTQIKPACSSAAGGRNVRFVEPRKLDTYEKARYDERLQMIIGQTPNLRRTAREIMNHMKADMRTRRNKNAYFGKKFCATKVAKQDFRYFEQKKVQKDIPDLAVGIVIDWSGSMHGRRMTHATDAAVALYLLFQQVDNMDISIMGHNGYVDVNLYPCVQFGENAKDDNTIYNIFSGEADDCNIDSTAVKAMGESLKKQPQKKKIMFIISDGQPSASRYGGVKAACRDIRFRKIVFNE